MQRGRLRGSEADLTSFVGRDELVDHSTALLRNGQRFVTVVGPGGIGKTRFACRVAAVLHDAEHFRDGVWGSPLDALFSPELLPETVLAAFGVQDPSDQPKIEALIDHLRDRHVLLVLDNCEHLLPSVRRLVGQLLRSCPQLHLIATSREPLRIDGERVLSVPPLDPATATDLLIDRAAAAGITIDAHSRKLAGDLADRLDRIPLAIEIASCQLSALGLEDLLARLHQWFQLLTYGDDGDQGHHRSLRTAVQWSWDLLSPAHQRLWARLSVFAGSHNLDAIEAVCGDADVSDPTALVADLVNKQIVMHRNGRYHMLDTFRRYGDEQLAALGEEHEIRRRHRAHYARLASKIAVSWCAPDEDVLLKSIWADWNNYRAVLSSSAAEDPVLGLRIATDLAASRGGFSLGLIDEVRRWLERLSTAAGTTASADLRCRALAMRALTATCQGQPNQARSLADDALTLVAEADTAQTSAMALAYADGLSALMGEQSPRAHDALAAAVEHARHADPGTLFMCLLFRAMSTLFLGEEQLARRTVEECCDHAQAHQAPGALSWAWWTRALLALWVDGDTDLATHELQRALQSQADMSDQWGTLWTSEALAWARAAAGDSHEAGLCLGAADRLQKLTNVDFSGLKPYEAGRNAALSRLPRTSNDTKLFDAAYKAAHDAPDKPTALQYALDRHTTSPTHAKITKVLTDKQREVAELVAQGLKNREIAERLANSPRTVEAHIEDIRKRLGLRNRAEIARWVEKNSG